MANQIGVASAFHPPPSSDDRRQRTRRRTSRPLRPGGTPEPPPADTASTSSPRRRPAQPTFGWRPAERAPSSMPQNAASASARSGTWQPSRGYLDDRISDPDQRGVDMATRRQGGGNQQPLDRRAPPGPHPSFGWAAGGRRARARSPAERKTNAENLTDHPTSPRSGLPTGLL